MKISELKPGMSNVSFEAQVISVSEPREINKMGRVLKVAEAVLEDDTGSITLSLWQENIEKVSEGSRVKVENAYVGTWQGKSQLTLGRMGKIEVV